MVKAPVRTSIYCTLLGGTLYLYTQNPSLDHYRTTTLHHTHQLLLLSWRLRNKSSEEHLNTVLRLARQDQLALQSFGVFSVVYRAHSHPEMCEYGTVFLRPRIAEYLDRVVDVGWLGNWYYQGRAMQDYDVNEEEWN